MFDAFDRWIDYLRISVTDKCNLRCRYCLPEEGVPLRRHEDYLSFEQLAEVVRVGVRLGLTKVRLTGGEPLVKRGIVELVRTLRAVGGLRLLAMTTNGTLLAPCAFALRRAGLDSLNISLDTLRPERYREITRRGEIAQVLEGVEAALQAGFPVKINMVVLEDTERREIEEMRRYCAERGMRLQLINHFVLGTRKTDDYRFDRPPSCKSCNRIRLLADGQLKPCLHSDEEIRLDLNDIEGSLRRTIALKPRQGGVTRRRSMMEIGG
jgi:cyclic pyranopterin phosphate synthase